MKRIDELGISPWPWRYIGYHNHKNGEYIHLGEVKFADGRKLCYDISQPNAHILSAAPDMYKTEYDLVDVIERLMNGWAGTCDTPTQDEVVAALEAAKNALAKAAGEEVAHGE